MAEIELPAEVKREILRLVRVLHLPIGEFGPLAEAIRRLVSSERERGEGLAEALEGLLSHLGPGGYIPGAGEPATRRAQAALSAWRGR